jgi:hypothetical protein
MSHIFRLKSTDCACIILDNVFAFLFVLEAIAFEASLHANIRTFGGTSAFQIFLHSFSLFFGSGLEAICC